jgi:hypothetical protein
MGSMNNSIDEHKSQAADHRSSSFMRLFGEMMMLPLAVFVQGMELFIKTIQGMQRVADDGMDVMAGGPMEPIGPAPISQNDQASITTGSETGGVNKDDAATNLKEKINMSDKDLSGKDVLKLVRYKILFIKRDLEAAFPEIEEVVSDPMDDCDYAAWKVAEFIQRLSSTRVPSKWGGSKDGKQKPKYPPQATYNAGKEVWYVNGLPEDDKKYLRVYFEVLARYDREEFKYHEQQIKVLEEIRDRIKV